MKYSTKKGGKRKNKNKSKRRQQRIMGGAAGDWNTYVYQTKTRDDKKKLFRLCNEGGECYYIMSNALPDDVEADIKTMWDALIVRLNSNNKFKDINLSVQDEKDELESVKEWGNAPASIEPVSTQFVPSDIASVSTTQIAPSDIVSTEQVTTQIAPVALAPVTTQNAPVTTELAPVTTQNAPVTTELAPVTTELAPVTTELAPVTTELAPVSTELAPVSTELAPVANLLEEPLTEQPAEALLTPETSSPQLEPIQPVIVAPVTEEERRKEEVKSANELIENATKKELNKGKAELPSFEDLPGAANPPLGAANPPLGAAKPPPPPPLPQGGKKRKTKKTRNYKKSMTKKNNKKYYKMRK